MKTKMIIGFILVMFSFSPIFGQTKVALNQKNNVVATSKDNVSWGLSVNGKQIFAENYASVTMGKGSDNLVILENKTGEFGVVNLKGDFVVNFRKVSKISIAGSFIIAGNDAFDLNGKPVEGKQITAKDMSDDAASKIKDGMSLYGKVESLSDRNAREYNTQPRIVKKDGKDVLMFKTVEFISGDKISFLTAKELFSENLFWFAVVTRGEKSAVVAIDSKNPEDKDKLVVSIALKYKKIEKQQGDLTIVNCYLENGAVEERWWDGKYLNERPRPTSALATK